MMEEQQLASSSDSRFSTTALHQTNVKLTWDETDPGRQRATMRKFKKEDLLEMDFNAYLASSSDEERPQEEDGRPTEEQDSSEDEDKKIDKYKVSFVFIFYFIIITHQLLLPKAKRKKT